MYGYGRDATEGGFASSVDTLTLTERWRTPIFANEIPNSWGYPGVALAHGNGFIYAIYANVLVKLDPSTGATLARRELPEDPAQTGAGDNGMIVMPEVERGPCPPATAVRIGVHGENCYSAAAQVACFRTHRIGSSQSCPVVVISPF